MSKPTLRITAGPDDGLDPIGTFITVSVPLNDLEQVGVLMTPSEAAETAAELLALAEDCINADRAGRRS